MSDKEDEPPREHNIFRDGKVHILAAMCETCIFKPGKRFVPGSTVAELVTQTRASDGATVPCHSTLMAGENHAICRGWWDRFWRDDALCRLAVHLKDVAEDEPPPKE